MIESSKGSIRLLRDVSAFLVPSGDKIKLVKGSIVQITQALGGNYTVLVNHIWFRFHLKMLMLSD